MNSIKKLSSTRDMLRVRALGLASLSEFLYDDHVLRMPHSVSGFAKTSISVYLSFRHKNECSCSKYSLAFSSNAITSSGPEILHM